MKIYRCICGQLIFFESTACVNCQRELGFLPDKVEMYGLEPIKGGLYKVCRSDGALPPYQKCQNRNGRIVCNWMIPGEDSQKFCVSCRLDEIIPNLAEENNRRLWEIIEKAKRRLIYTLLSLELPLKNRVEDPENGLGFKFLSDDPDGKNIVLTGHEGGIITLNIAEADDVERERRRISLKEPYRTLLGHFRHEVGHYYWDRLISDTRYLEPFRALFGNEQADYGEALKKYYDAGSPPNWQDAYISAYATSHPWEDWAETWAHYLHIQDTLEVANQFGLVDKRIALHQNDNDESKPASVPPTPFEEKIAGWAQLSIALNSINRSMGLKDIYPFILSPPVVSKLHFIFNVISGNPV